MSDNNVKSDLNNDNIASFKKKNVPVASLIRIITKPDHNCFNEMILTKSVNIESNSLTFMFLRF